MLFGFIQNHLSYWWSVQSYPDSVTDDDPWQKHFIENSFLDTGESSTIRPLLGFVSLNPSGLNISGSNQQYSSLQFFFKIENHLLEKMSEQNFMAFMWEIDKKRWLFLTHRNLNDPIDFDKWSQILIVAFKMGNDLQKCNTDLLFGVGILWIFGKLGSCVELWEFLVTFHMAKIKSNI